MAARYTPPQKHLHRRFIPTPSSSILHPAPPSTPAVPPAGGEAAPANLVRIPCPLSVVALTAAGPRASVSLQAGQGDHRVKGTQRGAGRRKKKRSQRNNKVGGHLGSGAKTLHFRQDTHARHHRVPAHFGIHTWPGCPHNTSSNPGTEAPASLKKYHWAPQAS